MPQNYLRKKGEPRPIGITAQEIGIAFMSISILFASLMAFFPIRKVKPVDSDIVWWAYTGDAIFLFLFLIIIFGLIAVIFLCYALSKYNLNMWTDHINPDWQGTLRIDKTGSTTNQIMKKDSLGMLKGIAFGKKAGLITRNIGLHLTTPNGNPIRIVMDFMSHDADPLEAIGWTLYKRKYGVIGYNAYKKCKKEKKTLLTINNEGKEELANQKNYVEFADNIKPESIVSDKSDFVQPQPKTISKKKRWEPWGKRFSRKRRE